MKSKEVFSRNLNYYIAKTGKSRPTVAEELGVSYYTLVDWSNGKKYPRMDKVEKLAQYFGIKISDLIEERTIESNPVETAGFHARILTDTELLKSLEEYYELSPSNQKMVRDLIHNLQKQES